VKLIFAPCVNGASPSKSVETLEFAQILKVRNGVSTGAVVCPLKVSGVWKAIVASVLPMLITLVHHDVEGCALKYSEHVDAQFIVISEGCGLLVV
jgi:hypothetical protein